MSAYNLLIPFISGCCCQCVFACVCVRVGLSKTDGGWWLCLCVGNESISFALVSLRPTGGGRVPRGFCVASLFLSSLFLSQFFTYARGILSLSFSVSVTLLYQSLLPIFALNPLSQSVHLCLISILSISISLSFTQSPFYSPTLFLCTYSGSILIFSCFSYRLH